MVERKTITPYAELKHTTRAFSEFRVPLNSLQEIPFFLAAAQGQQLFRPEMFADTGNPAYYKRFA
jgi:hypothetical protein